MSELITLLQDLATAFCAAFNAVYFGGRATTRGQRASHRIGSAAMALVSAAVAVESVFFLALRQAFEQGGSLEAFMAPAAWFSARMLLFLGTAFVSVLILRQELRR